MSNLKRIEEDDSKLADRVPRPPYLIAEIWGCGDEVCDCWQPQITLIKPHNPPRPPWILRETVWEGTFRSWPELAEWDAMRAELRAAAAARDIPLREVHGSLVGLKTVRGA